MDFAYSRSQETGAMNVQMYKKSKEGSNKGQK